MAFEAVRLAVRFMTPVFLLSDGYLANGAEPWLIPNPAKLPKIEVTHPTGPNSNGNGDAQFLPYKRDERLVRPWAIPGTPGLEHRIGGLEKEDVTGNVSYDPANHEHMVHDAGSEDRQHRQRHPAAGSGRPGRGRPAGDRLGRHLRRASLTAVQRAQRKGLQGGPAPTCATSTRCRATPATC